MAVAAHTTLIFTTYLVGAFDVNQYTTTQACELNATYAGGVRYAKDDTTDQEMEDWTDWSAHTWDSDFWLQGTILTVDSQRGREPPFRPNSPCFRTILIHLIRRRR